MHGPGAQLEEVLSNAVYHKNYELGYPVEIQVLADRIIVLSYPGSLPPVDKETLKNERQIFTREYRNRRIGDLLKELHLTEGRGTGFPAIYDAMAVNGSPEPIFETDGKTYTLVTLKIHPGFQAGVQVGVQAGLQDNKLIISDMEVLSQLLKADFRDLGDQAGVQAEKVVEDQVHGKVMNFLEAASDWVNRSDLFEKVGLGNYAKNKKRYLDPLVDLGWITMEFPDKKAHPNQRHKITESDRRLLNLILLNEITI